MNQSSIDDFSWCAKTPTRPEEKCCQELENKQESCENYWFGTRKKVSWANISKMNGYFGKNFGHLSQFLLSTVTALPQNVLSHFGFWNGKISFIVGHLYSKSDKNVVYYSELRFIIEKKLAMKFLHLSLISSSVTQISLQHLF